MSPGKITLTVLNSPGRTQPPPIQGNHFQAKLCASLFDLFLLPSALCQSIHPLCDKEAEEEAHPGSYYPCGGYIPGDVSFWYSFGDIASWPEKEYIRSTMAFASIYSVKAFEAMKAEGYTTVWCGQWNQQLCIPLTTAIGMFPSDCFLPCPGNLAYR